MKIGYGTHSGIHNVLFEGNRVDFAGVAIKVSSHLGWVSIHNYQPVASSALNLLCLSHAARAAHFGIYPSTTLLFDRQALG